MTTEQYKGEHTGLDLLKVGSKDVFTDNISKIGQLFPEVLTEKEMNTEDFGLQLTLRN